MMGVNLSTPGCTVHHLMLHLPVVVAMPHQSQGVRWAS